MYGFNTVGYGGGSPFLSGGGLGYQPTINVIVPWPQNFGLAYQQFMNSGLGLYGGGSPFGGGFPMGGFGGSPLGLGGYGALQGVPFGFGVTTN